MTLVSREETKELLKSAIDDAEDILLITIKDGKVYAFPVMSSDAAKKSISMMIKAIDEELGAESS